MWATFWLHMCSKRVKELSSHIGIVMSRRILVIRYHFACIAICAPHLNPCRGYGPKPGKGNDTDDRRSGALGLHITLFSWASFQAKKHTGSHRQWLNHLTVNSVFSHLNISKTNGGTFQKLIAFGHGAPPPAQIRWVFRRYPPLSLKKGLRR